MSDHRRLRSTFDILFVVDCSLSMLSSLTKIRTDVIESLAKIAYKHVDVFRFGLIEFRSNGSYPTRMIPFMSDIESFIEILKSVSFNDSSDTNLQQAFDFALEENLNSAFSFDWRTDKPEDNDVFHENLLILITNEPPSSLLNGNDLPDLPDLWTMADEFNQNRICLTSVGVGSSVAVCDDFYCALSEKTGGQYIPLSNARTVLASVIHAALKTGDTLLQAFRHLHMQMDIEIGTDYNYDQNYRRVRFMLENCNSMRDIRRQHHRNYLSLNEHDSLAEFYFEWDRSTLNLTISPTTTDEGYRSRLPTGASSFIGNTVHSIDSPRSFGAHAETVSDFEDDVF